MTTRAEANRYVGTVQARHEVEQAFRVGGKVARAPGRRRPGGARRRRPRGPRRHRLPARRGSGPPAARRRARRRRGRPSRIASGSKALKTDGSVSVADDERARQRRAEGEGRGRGRGTETGARAQSAQVHGAARLARAASLRPMRFEVGQVVAEGPAGGVDRWRGRARDRGRRSGRSPRSVQGGAVQGIAREPRRTRPSTSSCASSRRRPCRRRGPTALA